MEKCPKCHSYKTRLSRRQSKSEHRPFFYSLFRCQDCGSHFLSADQLRIQLWIMSVIVLCIFGGVGVWVFRQQPASFGQVKSEDTIGHQFNNGSYLVPIGRETAGNHSAMLDAAEGGDPEAQYQLGLNTLQQHWEHGSQALIGDAVAWIRRAAEQNHIRAQLVLGTLYEKGRGVIQDDHEAIEWYRRAANQGDAIAMSQLGQMIRFGRGTAKNPVEAYAWLNLASARGDTYAEIDRAASYRPISLPKPRITPGSLIGVSRT